MYKFYLLLVLVSSSFAQSINFDEALEMTLKNNKDLKNQKLQITNAKLDLQNISSANYGKLKISEQVSRTNHSGYVFNSKLSSREAKFKDFGFSQMNEGLNTVPTDLNYPKSRNNFNTKITYDIPLFTGFKLSNQKDILKLQKKAQELKYTLDKKELSFEALKAYNGAVVAKEFIKAVTKAKEAISFMVKSANAFHKEGLVTKIDVKQARVHELNINANLLEAQNKFKLAIQYLRFLTSNNNIKDVKTLKYIKNNQNDFKELYSYALKNRDEVKMQNIQVNAMKKNIKVANSSYYPSIYTHLEYGFNDDKLSLDKDKDYYIAMLGVDFTLFDSNRKAQVEKNKIQYKKALLNHEKLQDGIKLEVQNALLNLQTKQKILKEKTEAKNLAKEVFEQSKLLYKNHLISMTNLIEQEANLRKNEANEIMAKYENSLAYGKLNLVLGNKL